MITIMARVGIPIGRWNFDPSLPDAYKCIINVFLWSYDCIPSSLEREREVLLLLFIVVIAIIVKIGISIRFGLSTLASQMYSNCFVWLYNGHPIIIRDTSNGVIVPFSY